MNKQELVSAVHEHLGDEFRKTEVVAAIDAVFHVIQKAVAAGEKVSLVGFGVFEKVDRDARTGRNPATGGAVEIAATSLPKFRAGAGFKAMVARGHGE